MLTVISESLKSKVLELQCLHHRCMQLREVAEILYEEQQLVANDSKTQARLGNAGRERVIRDFKVLFIEQEKLHREIKDHYDMTPEEFAEHINKDMRGIEAIEYLRAMTGRLGGIYNV